MAYKGDSPGKAVTRYRLWSNAASLSTDLHMRYKGAYVLGGEGGDITVLSSLGIPHHTITAVDYDKDTADKLSTAYPDVTVIHGEAGKSAKDVQFNVAHLDFCGRLSIENILTYADVVESLDKPGCIIVTLLKGRETSKGGLKSKLWSGVSRQTRRELLGRIRKGKSYDDDHYRKLAEHILSNREGAHINVKYILDIFRERVQKVFGPALEHNGAVHINEQPGMNDRDVFIREDMSVGPLCLGMLRLDALRSCAELIMCMREMQKRRVNPTYVSNIHDYGTQIPSCLTYHSKTKKDHGTPFVSGLVYYAPWSIIEGPLQNPTFMQSHSIFMHLDSKASMEQLKSIVCNMPHYPADRVAEMFKIKKGTVSAWRAHKTMGTYDKFVEPVITMSAPDANASFTGMYAGWGDLYRSDNGKTTILLGDDAVMVKRTADGKTINIKEKYLGG